SSRRRHTRFSRDWSSDVCSSDLPDLARRAQRRRRRAGGAMTTTLGFSTESSSRRAERVRLLAQPAIVLVLVAAVLIWAFSQDLDATDRETLNGPSLLTMLYEHMLITLLVSAP